MKCTIENEPTWIEVNLSAVEDNTRYCMQLTRVPLMAVIKADAHGHGAVEVAKAALHAGASWLAVARFIEARALRQEGIDAPLLVLGMITPEDVDEAIHNNVTITLHSYEVADMLSGRARAVGKPANAHLKIDTGMGRLGVLSEQIVEFARYVEKNGDIRLDGLFSHFSMADFAEHPFTSTQIERFEKAVDALDQVGIKPPWIHIANSSATLTRPKARFTMTRAGQAILGLWPFEDTPPSNELRPAFSWKTSLASAKCLPKGWKIGYGQTYTLPEDQVIGVIPVGYGDGFRRAQGNEVIIDGYIAPVVGRICLDQTMVLLPKEYPLGTEIVLIGSQGNAAIDISDVAKRWNTDSVGVCTGIHHRVPRRYIYD